MWTAFPDLLLGPSLFYYFKIQFPVAILGAIFDTLSFFITIYIIKKALKSMDASHFIGHLSIDLVIAVLATFWVLFVFSTSSWMIRQISPLISPMVGPIMGQINEVKVFSLSERQNIYQERATDALQEPGKHLLNIYFGLVMGVSAMIPTCIHLYMAFRSLVLVKVLNPAMSKEKSSDRVI